MLSSRSVVAAGQAGTSKLSTSRKSPQTGRCWRCRSSNTWASAGAAGQAKAVMRQRYAQEGFDPPAFMKQLGVQADFGAYRNA